MNRRPLNLYQDIYSALFEWNLKMWHGDDEQAAWMTAIGLAGAVGMNLVLAMGVVVVVYGTDTLREFVPKWSLAIVIAAILTGNYAVFVWNDRYQKLVRRFRNRPAPTRRRITVIAWSYVVVSYVTPMAFAFTAAALTQG